MIRPFKFNFSFDITFEMRDLVIVYYVLLYIIVLSAN